ncbi:MAG: hypothetical protein GY757_12220, partial [bacterium]|nr:hypothetical protein [bacterium]
KSKTARITSDPQVPFYFIQKRNSIPFASTPLIETWEDLPALFTKTYFEKPLVLVLDEFDSLDESLINRFANLFRSIYIDRLNETDKNYTEKSYLLHGVALVGVRSVLGIENRKGSPFNVQRSLKIPNLTYDEVKGLFLWYEKESGQKVEQEVIERLFYETRGQPGLTCWFGEILSEGFEGYVNDTTRPIAIKEFEWIYRSAIDVLPNNNILNIISKARREPYKDKVLRLFRTDEPLPFRFDDRETNYLYMNGVIEPQLKTDGYTNIKFACSFVQKRLFNYFAADIFDDMGQLLEPLTKIDNIVTPAGLNIPELMKLYQKYIDKNKTWLFKKAPRRSDMRIYEAVFHFNLFAYLDRFLRRKKGYVFPEFPTGNGKIDLLIRYSGHIYGIELKSFTDEAGYKEALKQAAKYGKQLKLPEIFLVAFVETIDEKSRKIYEADYKAPEYGVTVTPIIIQTGTI